MVFLIAVSDALKTTLALGIIFGVVFPGLVTGLIIFAVAQALTERQQNQERQTNP